MWRHTRLGAEPSNSHHVWQRSGVGHWCVLGGWLYQDLLLGGPDVPITGLPTYWLGSQVGVVLQRMLLPVYLAWGSHLSGWGIQSETGGLGALWGVEGLNLFLCELACGLEAWDLPFLPPLPDLCRRNSQVLYGC